MTPAELLSVRLNCPEIVFDLNDKSVCHVEVPPGSPFLFHWWVCTRRLHHTGPHYAYSFSPSVASCAWSDGDTNVVTIEPLTR